MINQLIASPILLALFAGFANGAFLSPIGKNTKNQSAIWFVFGFLTYFIFPCIILTIAIVTHLYHITLIATFMMLLTGILYGFGLYLLTKSIKQIGIGVPLALNISLGILSGSFFSIVISGHFGTIFNIHYFFAYAVIITAIILYSLALLHRDKNASENWRRGFVFAFWGSMLCASQGACLSYYSDFLKGLGQGYLTQLIPWALIFFGCSFVFILSHYRDHRLDINAEKIKLNNLVFRAGIMCALQVMSILIYTFANTNTKAFSQIYLWGIFMVCIVISSTICSYLKSEWPLSNIKANVYNMMAILLLSSSIFILVSST